MIILFLSLYFSEHTLDTHHRHHPVPCFCSEKNFTMLIKNSHDRAARHQDKIDTVLRYLARESYSDFLTLNRLFGFKNHRGLYDLLNKLGTMGALKKQRLDSLSLWRITAVGYALAHQERPRSQTALSTLHPHTRRKHLATQNARLSFEAKGGTNWQNTASPAYQHAFPYRPDALITLPNGTRAAVEINVSMKTHGRYKDIVKHHLMACNQGIWSKVYWVLPSDALRNAVRMQVLSITSLTINARSYPLDAAHYAVFRFITLEELGKPNTSPADEAQINRTT